MLNGAYSEKLTIAANQNLKEKAYWLDKLSGEPEKTVFFYDYQIIPTAPGETGGKKEAQAFEFTGEMFQLLMKLSNGSDARLQMILTAALTVLLHKYTGSSDIILGTPIYKQEAGSEFINTVLALRNTVKENMTFKELLLQVRKTIVEAVENQNYPIEVLVEKLDLEVTPGLFPLFDTAVVVENVQPREYLDPVYEDINILFAFKRTDVSVNVVLEYNPSRYKETTVQRIAAHFSLLLETVLRDVDREVTRVGILTREERKQLLEDFNNKTPDYPTDIPFHRLFEEEAARIPHGIAVISYDREAALRPRPETGGMYFTYDVLNKKANRLARVLRRRGIGADTVVSLMMDRTMEMIVGVLGIMKAGGAYLPVDPDYPDERIAFMLEDSKTPLLVTRKYLLETTALDYGNPVIDLDDPGIDEEGIDEEKQGNLALTPPVQPGDLVYVVYTSGSTGKPKGVMVQHDQLVNAALGWRDEYRLREIEVNHLQLASFSFDVFAGDVARTFLNGGKMVIAPTFILDARAFYNLITFYRVTLLESTPSYVIPFMDYVYEGGLDVSSLKLLILGSDICPAVDFKRLLLRFGGRMRILNSYGVTEATIDSSYYEEDVSDVPVSGNVPIGKPLPNVRFYILDAHREPVPVGVPGELYIGGAGVARGYLYREELSAQRLLPDPFDSGGRMYKTGDRARWLPCGNVEFLGRMDNQVKIRGFRVELGEIENRLLEHENIKEAVVLVKGGENETAEKYICAYIVPENPGQTSQDPDSALQWTGELKDYLSRRLPNYMVPGFIVQLERIPLTPNGKVDRKALMALKEVRLQLRAAFVAPRNELENLIARIWKEVLGLEEVGIHDNFFDIGGNSFDIIKVNSKLEKELERNNPVIKLFKYPTIGTLSHYLEHGENEEDFTGDSEKVTEKKDQGKNRLKERARRRKTDLRSDL